MAPPDSLVCRRVECDMDALPAGDTNAKEVQCKKENEMHGAKFNAEA